MNRLGENKNILNISQVIREARRALGNIDIWDPKYDYLEHDHWLISKFSADCKLCLDKANATSSQTIVNAKDETQDLIIPLTPLASNPHISRAFMTPMQSCSKFNNTFTRSNRQSARKILNSTQSDLINLNETYDLYTSALAETPDLRPQCLEEVSSCDGLNNTNGHQPSKSLITAKQNTKLQHHHSQIQPQQPVHINNHKQPQLLQQYQLSQNHELTQNSGISRIPRTGIPVRSSRI